MILEAQASGIPVAARDVGGVAEVLTAGGRLMPAAASAADWAAAIELILADPARYETLSVEAERNAHRPEFDADRIVERFLEVAHGHIGRGAPRRAQRAPGAPAVADGAPGADPG